ncbi:MAG: Co2+/Mg2+ efflux protein ApaG [Pseudomonadota bacterium]
MVRGKPSPSYEADTDGIVIRVVPRFLHDESEPAKARFVWAYTVEIVNTSERVWTLTTRHWQIVDAQGRTQFVDGEGVVGQTPRLEPGESFRYTSGAPLAAPSGVMGGAYDFEGEDGAHMTAKVPTFSLDSPYERARPS